MQSNNVNLDNPQKEEVLDILKQILKWQKIQGTKILKDLIISALDDNYKKYAYEKTGELNRDELCKQLVISSATLSKWWKDWFSMGIIEQEGKGYSKLISLKDLGIEVPTIEEITSSRNTK